MEEINTREEKGEYTKVQYSAKAKTISSESKTKFTFVKIRNALKNLISAEISIFYGEESIY